MRKFALILTALSLTGMLAFQAVTAAVAEKGEATMPWPPKLVRSKIAVTPGGYHSTTRGTIRLVFPCRGKWLVFRGGPNAYHFSEDGVKWTATEAPQASRSHLIRGDTIYTFYSVMVKGAPDWSFDHFVCRGTISGTKIAWDKPHKLDTRVSYYPDLKQDTKGHFTMTGRAVVRDEKNEPAGTEVLWKRTVRPGDISRWGPDVRCIHHVGDHGRERSSWKKIGSTAHENLVLEGGKSFVIGMMTSGGEGKLLGNLHDGKKWGAKDLELATGMSTWAGTDRRMCAVFDKRAKVIHLAYVTAIGRLIYRSARPPYGAEDWSKPLELQRKTFTVVLSLDTSRKPAHVYALFGRTKYQGRDRRNTYGELHLQRFDGKAWSKSVLVSEPETTDNWYPNMNEDVRHGIGIVYLRGSGRTRKGEKPPLDIMFASTGRPK